MAKDPVFQQNHVLGNPVRGHFNYAYWNIQRSWLPKGRSMSGTIVRISGDKKLIMGHVSFSQGVYLTVYIREKKLPEPLNLLYFQ